MVVVTLPVTYGWRPGCKSDPVIGHLQFEVDAKVYEWAVETNWSCIGKTEPSYMHGPWDEQAAKRFALSMGNGDRSKAVRVAPYRWCEAYGVVPESAIHAFDETAQCARTVSPSCPAVLV